MYHGIINIYKEAGYTSHDVVAKLRGILGQKKIGHTGTLDPDAVGVLPVCLGNGTRLCDMLSDNSKEYRAKLRLGITTDTQDMSGTVLTQKEVFVTEKEVADTAYTFLGSYEQVPPMYSALKVNGKKLYELAREGKVIERKARTVQIEALDILQMELPVVEMRIVCSKGTYIRTLCNDIGEKLGCGGAMESLLRSRVGSFQAEDALLLSDVEKLSKEGGLQDFIIPVEKMFSDLGENRVKSAYQKLLQNGNQLTSKMLCIRQDMKENEKLRIYSEQGVFYGIYRYEKSTDSLFPVKMFPPE